MDHLFLINTTLEKDIYKIDRIIDQETGEIITIDDILSLEGNIYVNDLDIAFLSLILELKKRKLTNVFNVSKNNQFSFYYASGECFNIKIRYNDHDINIINFKKKFGVDFGDFKENTKLLEYARNHNRLAKSIGVDAFNEWMQSHFFVKGRKLNVNACWTIFRRRDYPILKNEILDRAKEFTCGYQFSKQGYYENLVFEYDRSSSYPSQLLSETPIGKPIEYSSLEDIPSTYFFIVKLTALDIKIKPNCIDWLSIDNRNVTTLILTKHLYKLFLDTYTYFSLKIKQIIGFKTSKGVFTNFIQNTIIEGKINENDKRIAKYNKYIANSLNGYFGKNTTKMQTKFVAGKIVSKYTETDPIYLPVYLYVTGKAKAEFVRKLQEIGKDNIIYANTDGFLTTNQIDLDMLNFDCKTEVGAFKKKNTYKQLYIECVNGYAGLTIDGTIDNTIAGLSATDKVSVDNYRAKRFDYIVKEITPSGLTRKIIHL